MPGQTNDLVEGLDGGDETFAPEQYVDIHCHCLAGLDDGPAAMPESLALCKTLADEGIIAVIATPHQLGRYSQCNDAPQIRQAVVTMNQELEARGIALTVVAGADVRVDERICSLIEADKVLTLADGGRYILLELPHEVLLDIEPLITDLDTMGVQVVLSHPERHPGLRREPDLLLKWLECSAHLQITAGSLLGDFGSAAQRSAWRFMESGWVSFVATDSHDLHDRKPRMAAAFEQISLRFGRDIAGLLCIENPNRVLEGRQIPFASEPAGRSCGR